MTDQTQSQFSLVHSHGRTGPNMPNTVAWDVSPALAQRVINAARTAKGILPKHSIVFVGPDSDWLISPKEPPVTVRQVEVAVTARDYWLEAMLEDGSLVTSSRISVMETAEHFGIITDGLVQNEKRRFTPRLSDDRRHQDTGSGRAQHGNRHHRRNDRHGHTHRNAARH